MKLTLAFALSILAYGFSALFIVFCITAATAYGIGFGPEVVQIPESKPPPFDVVVDYYEYIPRNLPDTPVFAKLLKLHPNMGTFVVPVGKPVSGHAAPEPMSIFLVGAGIVGFVALRKCKK